MVRPELNATATERVKGMIGLCDCVHTLIEQQMDASVPDATIRRTQEELNGLYDSFSSRFGLVNSRGNALAFADDSNLRLVCLNTIVTGYDDDVVMAYQNDTTRTFEYRFADCLLRTPAVEADTVSFRHIQWETPKDSVQGKQHFVKIDETNLDYDFHLDSLSTAQGKGCY